MGLYLYSLLAAILTGSLLCVFISLGVFHDSGL